MDGQTSRKSMPSLGILFRESWKLYKQNFLTLVAIILVPIVIVYLFALVLPLTELNTAISLYISSLENPDIEISFGFGVFLYFVLFLVFTTILFILSAIAIVYNLIENTGVFSSYALGLKKFWPYFWITVLSSIITVGGFILAIIPGIIFSVLFIFSVFILVKEDKRGMEALLRSGEYIRGYWWAVFGRFLLLILIFIVIFYVFASLVNPLGQSAKNVLDQVLQIIITPIFFVYFYSIYSQLKKMKPALSEKAVNKNKSLFVFIGILGLIVSITLITIVVSYFFV